MSKPFETGDMVILVSAITPEVKKFVGQIHKLGSRCQIFPNSWEFDPQLSVAGHDVSWSQLDMRPIRDQPGNEQFVVEARKSLPRSKPATAKGDTITERGELQS